jgi:pSer/pThr/pTyr-binding forkhead associated (FHA) protein
MLRYVLKFISGKYQGGDYALPANGEVVVGRTAEAEIMIVEELVSRRHARLILRGAALTLNDLGSTNGTFVNGEKIKSSAIKIGDRILIGSSVMQVEQEDRAPATLDAHEETVVGESPLAGKPAAAPASAPAAAAAERPWDKDKDRVIYPQPMGPSLTDLNPAQLQLWQLAVGMGSLEAVLKASPGEPTQTIRELKQLLDKGYLRQP